MTDTHRHPMTDDEIKKEKPLSADFASFRAGIRCAERLYLARIAELEAALAQQGEPAWYHAECADPDYSRFTQDKAEAYAIVSDKGGYVTELFAAPEASELLVALIGMVREYEGYFEGAPEPNSLVNARAAIAKATCGKANWKLVPMEPTQEMLDAAISEVLRVQSELDDEAGHSEIYQTMLAAAPAPQTLAQQGEPTDAQLELDEGDTVAHHHPEGWKPVRKYARAILKKFSSAPAAQPDDAIIRAWQAGYYHAGYTNDQSYADKMAREYAGAAPAAQPLTPEHIEAAYICHKAGRVSVSMVQRKMRTGYNYAQKLVTEIVAAHLVDGLEVAGLPNSAHGIGADK